MSLDIIEIRTSAIKAGKPNKILLVCRIVEILARTDRAGISRIQVINIQILHGMGESERSFITALTSRGYQTIG